jgi:NADH-quinone oxidoreductase subunit C
MLEKIKNLMTQLSPLHLIETDYARTGFHLDVRVRPEQVVEAAEILDREEFFLEAVTGVDWLGQGQATAKKVAASGEDGEKPEESPAGAEAAGPVEEQMEVVYDYGHPLTLCHVVVRAMVPRGAPEIPTVSEVFPGANWHERETHDFFGIRFIGHPDLSPLLLPEDADFHPLLKDFNP